MKKKHANTQERETLDIFNYWKLIKSAKANTHQSVTISYCIQYLVHYDVDIDRHPSLFIPYRLIYKVEGGKKKMEEEEGWHHNAKEF